MRGRHWGAWETLGCVGDIRVGDIRVRGRVRDIKACGRH